MIAYLRHIELLIDALDRKVWRMLILILKETP